MIESGEDLKTYKAIVNGDGQYSLWVADREIPNGWFDTGRTGSRQECLSYIGNVWQDMRPLSLRKTQTILEGAGAEVDSGDRVDDADRD